MRAMVEAVEETVRFSVGFQSILIRVVPLNEMLTHSATLKTLSFRSGNREVFVSATRPLNEKLTLSATKTKPSGRLLPE
jgi:hypothetical protein